MTGDRFGSVSIVPPAPTPTPTLMSATPTLEPTPPTPTPILPPQPALFGGTATLDGVRLQDATTITAWIDGSQVASTTTTGGGYAPLVAQPTGALYEGKQISFIIGSITAIQIGIWEADGGGDLNLTGSTPEPIPQIIESNASGYNKYVGVLTWDYTVRVTMRVVNSGAAGSVAVTATVRWDGLSKTRSEAALMAAGEEREFVFEFQEVGSADEWTWNAEVRAI